MHMPARTQTCTEARRADSKSEVLAIGVASDKKEKGEHARAAAQVRCPKGAAGNDSRVPITATQKGRDGEVLGDYGEIRGGIGRYYGEIS